MHVKEIDINTGKIKGYGICKKKYEIWFLGGPPTPIYSILQFLRDFKSRRTSKLHHWFKSSSNFAEKREFFLLDKVVKLVGGGSVINRAYLI